MTKREEREARRVAADQARRERQRWERNWNARKRRAEKKFKAERDSKIRALIAVLSHLRNENANERANAALMVERVRARLGQEWSELIR